MSPDPAPSRQPSPDAALSGASIDIAPGVSVARSALRISASRASGPGGQNVNKRSTKVELRIALADLPLSPGALRRLVDLAGKRALRADIPPDAPKQPPPFPAPDPDATTEPPAVIEGELLIVSAEHRTQLRNKQECLDRLRDLIIRAQSPPKTRRRTRPTRASKERRLDDKKRKGEKKSRRQSPND